MEYIQKNTRGLQLVFALNWDRIVAVGVMLAAFYVGAFVAGH